MTEPAVREDLSPLSWVQGELRRSLEAMQKALRRHLRDAEAARGSDIAVIDPAHLRNARAPLHQGAGALDLVGETAAAQLLRAAEQALSRLGSRPEAIDAAVVETIERAGFAVLDFLARRLAGKPLQATQLFPQYRGVMALAGADRIHPADLWTAPTAGGPLLPEAGIAPHAVDEGAREALETLVLGLMRPQSADSVRDTEGRISALCAEVAAGLGDGPLAAFWHVGSAVFDALAAGLLAVDNYSKRTASALLVQMRHQVAGHADIVGRGLHDLLFFCAHAGAADGAPRLRAVRAAWQLDRHPTGDYEAAPLGRFDPALLVQARKRVAVAKDAWAAVAAGEPRGAALGEPFALLGESLQRLLPEGHRLAAALSAAADQVTQNADALTPHRAMEVATAVLYCEAVFEDGALDQDDLGERVAGLAGRVEAANAGLDAQPLEAWMEALFRQVSDRQTMGSVVQELRAALTEVEKQIDQYFRDPSRRELLIPVPAQLSSMRGVLSVLGLDQASAAVLHMRDDVEALAQTEVDPRKAVETGTFDRLANNLGALSFLIDLLGVQPHLAKSLFSFDAAEGQLRERVGRSERVSVFGGLDPLADVAAGPTASPVPPPAEAPAPAAAAPLASGLEDDAEMLGIFLEEADEVVAEARAALERLLADPERTVDLTAVRRAFHTLKGSSRMVGLNAYGEAAWACEQLYNDRLASAPRLDAPLRGVTQEALAYFSAWSQAIAAGSAAGFEAAPVAQAADALRLQGERRTIALPQGAPLAEPPPVVTEPAAEADEPLPPLMPAPVPAPAPSPAVDVGEGWLTLDLLPETPAVPDVLEVAATDAPAATPLHSALDDFPPLDLSALDAPAADRPTGDAPTDLNPAPDQPSWPSLAPDDAAAALRAHVPDLPSLADLELGLDAAGAPALPTDAATEPPPPVDTPLAWTALEGGGPLPSSDRDLPLPEVALSLPMPDVEGALPLSDVEAALPLQDVDTALPLPVVETLELGADLLPDAGPPPGADEAPLPVAEAIESPVFGGETGVDGPLADAPPVAPLPDLIVEPVPVPVEQTLPLASDATDGPAVDFAASADLDLPLDLSPGPSPDLPLPDDGVTGVGAVDLPLDVRLDGPLAPPLDTPLDVPLDFPATAGAGAPASDAPLADAPVDALPVQALPAAVVEVPAANDDPAAEEQVKVIGDLRISIPLFNIFLNEADEQSRRLCTELAEWAHECGRRPVPSAAASLAHALTGSSATVGYADLSSLARALEHALLRSHAQGPGTPEEAQLFGEAAEDIRRLLHQFAAGFLRPVAPEIMARLAEHERQPPRTVSPAAVLAQLTEDLGVDDDFDAELRPIYEEEADELLPELQARLRAWQAQPADADAMAACMRTLHTLKGGARLAGALQVGEIAHRLESRIEQLGDRGVVAAADVEPLLAAADHIAALYERQRGRAAEPVADAPVAPMVVPEPAPAFSVPAPGAESATPRPEPSLPPRATPSALVVAPMAVDWQRFAPREVVVQPAAPERAAAGALVRVRAGLLDRLVNQAGEVSITRARIGSGVRTLQGSVGELTESLERMRRQLRDIEVQAETQISSRIEAAKAEGQAFDPLEMDRYTRFQELTRFMAESVNDVATLQRSLQRSLQQAEDELAAQARLTRELQDDLLRTRMVDFDSIGERLFRAVRQAAQDSGKRAELQITGGSIEVDRGVLERMVGAFEHLLRNAVAHGVESPAARLAAGKAEAGQVQIQVAQVGNELAVEFGDDGAGLNLARIRQRAVERGLLAPEAEASEGELAGLIFMPGFSTADSVTELAGRGVGMDVVRADVYALGGRIETASQPGQGTRFRLLLPLTTAVTQVVMVRAGGDTIAVPAPLVELVRRLPTPDAVQAYADGHYVYDGAQVPFFWLPALLDRSGRGGLEGRTQTVVIVRSAAQRVAVHVDEVLGNQEVVVKNVGPQLARLPGLTGVTLLPSGQTALIYNPVALANVYGQQALLRQQAQPAGPQGPAAAEAEAPRQPLVLVVDDSLTVRRVTQRLLAREGYRVLLAKDGLDALEQLQGERPAVLLSDIEMPRMDGFDLVRNVRADARLADLPVVMITSRIAQKHRDYAAELGVRHYLGKPYAEDELLGLVARYAGPGRPV